MCIKEELHYEDWFWLFGPNAPQEVKDAWLEAAKEVNANGLTWRHILDVLLLGFSEPP